MTRPTIPLRPASVAGYGGMAVTPHVLSTQAAMTTLSRGGNAVDAAIAANAVQGVVAPETCGIGGDLFALVMGPGFDAPVALNASGRAGSGAADLADGLRGAGADAIPRRHPAAVSIPGCVDGWLELSSAHGLLDLSEVLAPAIRLARDGFPASAELVRGFTARAEDLLNEPGAADMYPGGNLPVEGDRLIRQELSRTLGGISERRRAGFYSGPVATALSEAVDGAITPEDLSRSQADWVEPLAVDVFGATAWTVPPNSQGYVALIALAIIDLIGLEDPEDPIAWHLAIESYRRAAADSDRVLADPDHLEIEARELLSPERIGGLADTVTDRRSPGVSARRGRGGTAYLCVADANGMGVSLIQSNFHGIGSGISVVGAGFLLQDRGRGFTLEEGHPNQLAPGKRPSHTLAPTLWTEDGRLSALIGTRGGHVQPQLVTQLAAGIMGHRWDPAGAMAFPRWTVDPPGVSGSPEVRLEPGAPSEVMTDLNRRGHTARVLGGPQPGWGPMSAIVTGTDGLRRGAADPRVATTAAATI